MAEEKPSLEEMLKKLGEDDTLSDKDKIVKLEQRLRYENLRAEIYGLFAQNAEILKKHFKFNRYRQVGRFARHVSKKGANQDTEEFVEGILNLLYGFELKGSDHAEIEKDLRNMALRMQDALVTGGLYTKEAYIRRLSRDPNDKHAFNYLKQISVEDFSDIEMDRDYDFDALHVVGRTLHKRGEHEESLKAFNLLLRKNPNYKGANLEMAKPLHALGRTDEAIVACKREIEINQGKGKDVDLWSCQDLARCLIEREKSSDGEKIEDFKEAEEVIKRAVEINPKDPWNYHRLGLLYQSQDRLDRVERAEKAFKKAIELSPNNKWLHRELGHLYMNNDKREEALEEYLDALRFADEENQETFKKDVSTCWAVNGAPPTHIAMFVRYYQKQEELIREGMEKDKEHEYMPAHLESIAGTEASREIDRALSITNIFADDIIHINHEYGKAGDINLRLAWLNRGNRHKKTIFAERAIKFYKETLKLLSDAPRLSKLPSSKPDEYWTNANLSTAYNEIGDEENRVKYLFGSGVAKRKAGEQNSAVQIFNWVLEADPNHELAKKELDKLEGQSQ